MNSIEEFLSQDKVPLQLTDVQLALRAEVQSFLGEIKTAMRNMERRVADQQKTAMHNPPPRWRSKEHARRREDPAAQWDQDRGRRRAIVIGGLRRDTPKDELLADSAWTSTRRAGVFATGIRRRTAIVPSP